MPKSKVRGESSERIAKGILEQLGYKVLETNKMVTLDDARAFEVDILALTQEGKQYCVEVKAGRAGVSDIRQVFGNSKLLNLNPLLVCKGFANEAAEAMARELQVEVINLSEHFILLEPEELEVIVSTAVQNILDKYGFYPLPDWKVLQEEDWKLIQAITEAKSFQEAADHLQLSVEKLGQRLGEPRNAEVFPKKGQSFSDLKRHSRQLLHRYSLKRKLGKIEKRLKELEKSLSSQK